MAKKAVTKTFKFQQLRAEAQARASARKKARPEVEPFVLDDIQPPIVITPPTSVERQLVIAELLDDDGSYEAGKALPLLRALCGNQFGRVWQLIKDDEDPDTLILLVQMIFDHFNVQIAELQEAASLPGGSEASSD